MLDLVVVARVEFGIELLTRSVTVLAVYLIFVTLLANASHLSLRPNSLFAVLSRSAGQPLTSAIAALGLLYFPHFHYLDQN